MGPIQSSLNQLTLSALGAIAATAKGLKGGFNVPKAPGEPAKANVQLPAGTTPQTYAVQGEQTYTVGSSQDKSAVAELAAYNSGNDAIKQKARSSSRSIKERLAQIRKGRLGRK